MAFVRTCRATKRNFCITRRGVYPGKYTRMLLLRQFPDPKRLEPTAQNEGYRRAFYARWGNENSIILARSRRIEFPLFAQRLSIKVAAGGRERYLLTHPAREVDVDDDSFLILNDGHVYGSLIAQEREIESFSIFFRPGFADEVRRGIDTPVERALDGAAAGRAGATGFWEFLQPHDARITPVLKFIRAHVRRGVEDPHWYEEQLYFLLQRMLENQAREHRRMADIPALKIATRTEIYRRVMLAANYIQSCFDEDVSLDRLAAEACLSKFHFLRLFRQATGLTPYAFVLRKRALVASRLIASTGMSFDEIALQVGFASRSSLFRQMRRWLRQSPRELRGARRAQPRQ
jgi:AraC family transcriptional regulator